MKLPHPSPHLLSCSLLLATFGLSSACAAESPDSLNHRDLPVETVFELFENPPAEARPFVRWWWNNNQVEADELIRELDVFKAAGIGGVEINPILEPAYSWDREKLSEAEVLEWRSPEWDEALLTAVKGTQARGMIADLLPGSGWPYGGDFLTDEEQIQRLNVLTETAAGPATLTPDLKQLFKRKRDYGRRGYQKPPENPKLAFVWSYPADLQSPDQVRMHPLPADGSAPEIQIGSGPQIIAYGIVERGFRRVGNGVPGSQGPALDHFNPQAVRSYLTRITSIKEQWGVPLSDYVRALFCDSIELEASNWNATLTDSFERRKGYDIRPYLPFVIRPDEESAAFAPEFQETIRRARYDWSEHQAAAFNHGFTRTFHEFCRENDLLSRYQAYGNPNLMGMAEGYMIPDIPEGNNVIYPYDYSPYREDYFTWKQAHGYMTWTKYAAAGGHLRGKRIISTESMTNVLGFFQTTLATVKQADDMNFITGMTHTVLHGYNYSPPDVPFPGLIRFGTFFSEYNSWWPYFKRWADYNARLSAVFQNTRPVMDIALLAPTPDQWEKGGLNKDAFHMEPRYLNLLWEAATQTGTNLDTIHGEALEQGRADNGSLQIGPMHYPVLFVVEADSLTPASAETIRTLAEGGVKVVFIGQTPSHAPGLQGAEADRRVVRAMEAAAARGALSVQPPRKGENLRKWLTATLKQAGYQPPMQIESPDDGLYAIRHRAADADLLFFTNTNRKTASNSRVAFPLGNRSLWRWDPETGTRTPYAQNHNQQGFQLTLDPLESVLLIASAATNKPDATPQKDLSDLPSLSLRGPLQATFAPADGSKSFTVILPELIDFAQSPDPRIRKFSGTVTYTTHFEFTGSGPVRLDLGPDNDDITEVSLNGQMIGANWYGRPVFDLSEAVKPGNNELAISYTTTLFNSLIGTKTFDRLWNKFHRNEAAEPRPSGLPGPVQVLGNGIRQDPAAFPVVPAPTPKPETKAKPKAEPNSQPARAASSAPASLLNP